MEQPFDDISEFSFAMGPGDTRLTSDELVEGLLGLPHYLEQIAEIIEGTDSLAYARAVIDPFSKESSSARTPQVQPV